MSAYRGASRHEAPTVLAAESHASGVSIARCPSCRGAFVAYEDLVTIENAARRRKHRITDHAKRAYDPPTASIACPSCVGETTRREWSIATMVFVDVCVECRGVWLDSGELETLGG